MKRFKEINGKYTFIFKSELDEAIAGKREPVNLYLKMGPTKATYYEQGNSTEKNDIDPESEVIEVKN